MLRLPLLLLALAAVAAGAADAPARALRKDERAPAAKPPKAQKPPRQPGGKGKPPAAVEDPAEDVLDTVVVTDSALDAANTTVVEDAADATGDKESELLGVDVLALTSGSDSPTESPTTAPTVPPTTSPSASPTNAPSGSPSQSPTTQSPTLSSVPSSMPTTTPGAVLKWFCTEDEAPLGDEYCTTPDEFDEFQGEARCLNKCKGKKECVVAVCVTETPTATPSVSSAPTVSAVPTADPTMAPTVSLAPSTLEPTADVLDASDLEQNDFAFTGSQMVPFTPFTMNLVVPVESRRGRQLLRGDRRLEELFGVDQDTQLAFLVTEHLKKQFRKHSQGNPAPESVVLTAIKSSEDAIESGNEVLLGVSSDEDSVVATYGIGGHALYANGDGSVEPPTTAQLDGAVLDAFNTKRGSQIFINALKKSDDDVLEEVIFVMAETGLPVKGDSDPTPATAPDTSNPVEGEENQESDSPVPVTIVVVVASAFAATFLIIGFLTYRKYQRYQRNNASNDYHNYQSKKKKMTLGKSAKKYDHFESPAGSVVSRSEDALYNDLEIEGGETYPSSDADPTSPAKDPKQIESGAPYDEEEVASPSSAAYDMTYFAQEANSMASQSNVEDQTLDGLYSDKDSYFQSTVGAGHRRDDSIHSLDTMNDTFGFAADDANVSTLIDGIQEAMEQNGMVEMKQEVTSTDELELPSISTVRGHDEDAAAGTVNMVSVSGDEESNIHRLLDVTVSQDEVDNFLAEVVDSKDGSVFESDVESSSADASAAEEGKSIAAIAADSHMGDVATEAADEAVEGEVAPAQEEITSKGDDDTQDAEISTTDELYARITELEQKIINTEASLNNEVPTTPANTPAKVEESASEDAGNPSIQEGTFTTKTLDMIEESRLTGTPPPSEGEVDGEAIQEAKENPLLGKFLNDDSESEEEDCGVSIDGVMYG
ncbi:hypothetical protein ACHAXT_006311 [Thalassiosira profunda]